MTNADAVIEVAIALVWKDAQLLIQRRPLEGHLPGLWEFPGGKLEPGEKVDVCVAREVWEEVGVVCSPRAPRSPIDHVYPDRRVRLYPVDCDWVRGIPEARSALEVLWIAPGTLWQYDFPAANAVLVRSLVKEAAPHPM
jgi:mutator protein MutT